MAKSDVVYSVIFEIKYDYCVLVNASSYEEAKQKAFAEIEEGINVDNMLDDEPAVSLKSVNIS